MKNSFQSNTSTTWVRYKPLATNTKCRKHDQPWQKQECMIYPVKSRNAWSTLSKAGKHDLPRLKQECMINPDKSRNARSTLSKAGKHDSPCQKQECTIYPVKSRKAWFTLSKAGMHDLPCQKQESTFYTVKSRKARSTQSEAGMHSWFDLPLPSHQQCNIIGEGGSKKREARSMRITASSTKELSRSSGTKMNVCQHITDSFQKSQTLLGFDDGWLDLRQISLDAVLFLCYNLRLLLESLLDFHRGLLLTLGFLLIFHLNRQQWSSVK